MKQRRWARGANASPRRTRLRVGPALAVVLVIACQEGVAQESRLPPPAQPDGISVGPTYLTPFLGLGVARETNPFYQPQAQADTVTRVNPALGVMFPFLKSYVRASYNAMFRRFAETEVTNPNSHSVFGELSLLFSSFDRLVLLANRTSGASEVLEFDGGEATYDGTPFRYDVYTLGAERDVPGHLGYEAIATWSRLSFDQSDVDFFAFHGYDLAADAYVPLSSSLWVVSGAKVRRFDHVRTNDPTDSVFRKENADTLRAGVRGTLAGGRTYHAVLAYDWARYPGGLGSDSDGLVGDASIVLPVGPSSALTIALDRRRWSSFYGDNNYYLANTARLDLRRAWTGGSDLGAKLGAGASAYPDPESIAAGGPRRRDRLANFEVFGTFAFQRRCGFRLSYAAEYRHSNVAGVEYDTQTFGVDFVFGWR